MIEYNKLNWLNWFTKKVRKDPFFGQVQDEGWNISVVQWMLRSELSIPWLAATFWQSLGHSVTWWVVDGKFSRRRPGPWTGLASTEESGTCFEVQDCRTLIMTIIIMHLQSHCSTAELDLQRWLWSESEEERDNTKKKDFQTFQTNILWF